MAQRRDAAGLIFAVAFPTAAAWFYFITFADSPFMPAIYAVCKVLQFAFPLVWVYLNAPGSPGPVPIGRPTRESRDTMMGILSGMAIVILVWVAWRVVIKDSSLALSAGPRIAARLAALGAASPARFIALTIFISVIHSFLEEYYWRWFVLGRMRTVMGGLPSLLISSAAFAGHHVILLDAFIGPGPWWPVTVLLSFGVAFAGGLWAWLYLRRGSLYCPWFSHMVVDMGIMAIGYDLAGMNRM